MSQHEISVEDFITAVMEEASIPGLAISVIKNNKVVLLDGFGLANVEKNEPVKVTTPFNLASISKPILGISLLRLQDKGFINIDNDINEYLPFVLDNPNLEDEKITLRHLASHSSGLYDAYDYEAFGHNEESNVNLRDYVEQRLSIKGNAYGKGYFYDSAQPGTSFRYNNLGASLAGLALETTSEMSLHAFSNREIFEPLGMKNTAWQLNQLMMKDIAVPYELEACIPYIKICADESSLTMAYVLGKLFDPPSEYKTLAAFPHYGFPDYPAGGIRSSIEDLTLLIKAVLNNGNEKIKLLSDTSYQQMFQLAFPEDVAQGQRFFWQESHGMIGHGGSNPGAFTYAFFDVETKGAIIILMNRSPDALTSWALDSIIERISTTDTHSFKTLELFSSLNSN
ncbi:beta-lactamase [Colwellia psychrerythraea]|uniref:Beta-lactamase n=1 Tax=Colwellia psychrerythraea TaxID=28229 RepID=A0A099L097_COLPS|nr:beta-lactamase [Colwellia psychrerythraea]